MNVREVLKNTDNIKENPNYNPSDNNSPKYISTGTSIPTSSAADFAYTAASKDNIQSKSNIQIALENQTYSLEDKYEDDQSAWTKAGNSLVQTLSEITLGTAKGLSDLIGLGLQLTPWVDDYENPVSDFFEEQMEGVRELAPVNVDPNLHITNGGATDWGWWFSNLPSVASSLTMLIPSTGVVKGASAVGRAANIGARTRQTARALTGANKRLKAAQIARAEGKSAAEIAEAGRLNKLQRFVSSRNTAKQTSLFLENASIATLSRTIENYQEAHQVYNDIYVEASEQFKNDDNFNAFLQKNGYQLQMNGVDTNNKDEVAKYVANSAADRTFALDYANAIFDVVQIYALRNAWKGIKNAHGTPAKIRRKNIDAAKYVGKTEAEIAAIKKARPIHKKVGEWVADRAYSSKLIVGAQLSEGIEEGTNYVSQEEGMTFGRVLLGTQEGVNKSILENLANGFDGRLKNYVQSPELYDAAFWGVLGGIVFQGVGSGVRRVSNKITNKKSEANDESQRDMPWYKLDDLPENKRRLREIEARNIDYAEYKSNIDRINKGIDIYRSTPDNEVSFSEDPEVRAAEQQVARDKLKNEYIAKMTIRSLNSGNYKLLRTYLSDDNFRKALIENGVFNDETGSKTQEEIEQESKEYINDALQRMDRIARMYDEEIVAIDHASAQVNELGKEDTGRNEQLIGEYMQIMATENVFNRLGIENNNKELASINARISELRTQFSDKLDGSIDYENNIRLGVITHELGILRAKRRELLKDKYNLSNELSIKEIDKRIAVLESKLTDAELIYATEMSLTIVKDGDRFRAMESTPESAAYRDAMIVDELEESVGKILFEGDAAFDGVSERARTSRDRSTVGEYEVLRQDADATFGTLSKISPELDNLYQTKAALELNNDYLNGGIVRTVSEVHHRSSVLHNTMDEARKKAINEANKTIGRLYRKYGDPIRQAIYHKYYNDKKAYNNDISQLDESERELLNGAFDVLELTKPENTSLVDTLYDRLNRQDDIAAAIEREELEVKENSTDSTNSEAVSATSAPNLNDNTGADTNSAEQAKTGQSEGQTPVTDPQNLENRQPTWQAKYNNGQLIIGDSSSEFDIDGYDNGDGTFTIDVKNSPKHLKDEKLFGVSSGIDITRPFEVSRKPIVANDSSGKLVVIQTGEIRNTDTIEYQEEKEKELEAEAREAEVQNGVAQTEEQATNTNANTNSAPIANEDSQASAAVPSTGEVVVQEPQPASNSNTKIAEDVAFADETTIEFDVSNAAIGRFIKEYKANHDVNLDEIAEKIINELIKKGHDRSVVTASVNKAKGIIKNLIERKSKKTNSMMSSIDEVIINQINPLEKAYKDSVRELIEQYAKEFGIEKINGKYYINLEDLLRFVNSIASNNNYATMMFFSLKNYLTTEEAKKDFVITDENETNDYNKFLNNVDKSITQRYLERLGDTNTQRVDIQSILSTFSTEQEFNNFYDVLDNLQIGDKLTYSVVDNRIVLYDKNHNIIGSLPIPKINSSTGAYKMVNDGWITDILVGNNNVIVSKLKDTFSRWFNPTNEFAKELNAIIYELAYDKPSEERKQELLKKFAENPEVKQAKANGLVSATASNKQLINGLVKLWRYRDYASPHPTKGQNINIERSLNAWFENVLLKSYDGVMALVNNNIKEIVISDISEGEIIRATDDKAKTRELALPANRAIAGGANPDVHKISYSENGVLRTSGMPNYSFPAASNHNTFVIIPRKNGGLDYVQAFPANTTDGYIGDDAKDIVSALHKHLADLIKAHKENPTEDNFNKIKQFLVDALYSRKSPNSLFYNLVVSDNGNNVSITLNDNTKIIIKKGKKNLIVTRPEFPKNDKGYKEKENLSEEEELEYLNELLNNLRFNIRNSYIISDNNRNLSLEGIATRTKDGKFQIRIGDNTWTYDSYNEFILKNDLVRLNTKPNEQGTSNYSRKGIRSQKGNQFIRIKLVTETSSPVEESATQSPTQSAVTTTPSNISINDKAKAILESTEAKENKGLELAELVFDELDVKALAKLNLLPKNIIFDPEYNNRKGNENYNAEYDPKTGVVTVGTKWLALFNNANTRKRAIRILIHEQLHAKLQSKPGYVASAEEIYNEFEQYLANNNVGENEHIRVYLFRNERSRQIAIEEFLVESLTNSELATYLNGIDADVSKKRGGRNLFQKILKFMSELFGWGVREGSLYEKELQTLRDAFAKPAKPVTEAKTDKTTSKPVSKSDGTQLELDFNEEANDLNTEQETTTDETETQIEQTEPATEEPSTEILDNESNSNDPYGTDYSDDLMDKFFSSVDEQVKKDTNNTSINFKSYESTPEFERIQKESMELSMRDIQRYHKGYIGGINGEIIQLFGNEERQRLGRIYERILSRRTNARINNRIALKHTKRDGTIINFEIVEANPTVFHDIFEINRKYLPNGELVDLHDDYSNCRCFISTNGLCGFAIEKNGNIISVFSLNPSNKRGFLYAVKDFIINNGGNHLDCYVSNKQNLESIYKKVFGFQTASIMDYNMEYDHDNIYINHGNPKVVFMVKSNSIVKPKAFDENSYDKAVAYQTQNIDNTDIRHSSVTELANNIPSVKSMQDRLPIAQQAKFASLVASAAIQSSCR